MIGFVILNLFISCQEENKDIRPEMNMVADDSIALKYVEFKKPYIFIAEKDITTEMLDSVVYNIDEKAKGLTLEYLIDLDNDDINDLRYNMNYSQLFIKNNEYSKSYTLELTALDSTKFSISELTYQIYIDSTLIWKQNSRYFRHYFVKGFEQNSYFSLGLRKNNASKPQYGWLKINAPNTFVGYALDTSDLISNRKVIFSKLKY